MKKAQRLWQRDGTWYYRRAFPKHLIGKIGKKLIVYFLGVKDLAEAKKLRELEDVKWSARFDAAEKGSQQRVAEVCPSEMAEIVRAYVGETMQKFRRRALEYPTGGHERSEAIKSVETELAILNDPVDPRADQWVSFLSEKMLADHAPGATHGHVYAQIAELVRRALLEIDRRKLARYTNDFSTPAERGALQQIGGAIL